MKPTRRKSCYGTIFFCVMMAGAACAQEMSPATSMAEFCTRLPRPAYATLERVPYASDWFELYRVAPGVTAIYEPYQWQEVISYLIEGSEQALLFDTGNGNALLDAENGLLWTGDTFYEGPIWLYAPETDLDAYARSLRKLVQYVPQLKALLPAHNTPWVEPERLLQLQAGFKAMLAGQAQVVEQGHGMFEYRVPGVTAFSFLLGSETRP